MRKVKFRCWYENEMYHWDLLKQDAPCLEYLQSSQIMQSTGLKDKNGVEIYEGDVVTWERPFGNGMGSFKVGFGDGCFGIFDRQFLARVYVFEINESCEVIGNIYQNGNLLNG